MNLPGISEPTHSKDNLLVVKLRSFQNTSIEIIQISSVDQHNHFTVKKLICKMQNENTFTNKRFLSTLKRNYSTIKRLHF